MMTFVLLLAPADLLPHSQPIWASDLGACGNGRDVQTIVASASGAVVGSAFGPSYVGNPNNPTGTIVSGDEMGRCSPRLWNVSPIRISCRARGRP